MEIPRADDAQLLILLFWIAGLQITSWVIVYIWSFHHVSSQGCSLVWTLFIYLFNSSSPSNSCEFKTKIYLLWRKKEYINMTMRCSYSSSPGPFIEKPLNVCS